MNGVGCDGTRIRMLHYNNTDPTLPPTIPRFFSETVTHILLPFIPRFLGGGINRRSAFTEIPHRHALDAANARKKIRTTRRSRSASTWSRAICRLITQKAVFWQENGGNEWTGSTIGMSSGHSGISVQLDRPVCPKNQNNCHSRNNRSILNIPDLRVL